VSDIDACGLTLSELQELWLGVGPGGSLFSGEEELRDAWSRGRDVVMRLWGCGGRRPQIWWYLEAGDLKYPGYDHERSYLFEHNVLSEAEREQLLAGWRKEFEKACSLEDAAARKAHLDWADVPHSLRQQWQPARRRRAGKRTGPAPNGGAGPLKADAQEKALDATACSAES